MHWLPTAHDLGQFLDSFWPNFVATAAGLALGVPVGLAVDRWRQATASAEQHRMDRETLVQAIDELVNSIEFNSRQLEEVIASITAGRIPYYIGTET